jgi:Protein of unknown function (DUF3618)
MAESTADVQRDIEATRTRISGTLVELENKLNVAQMVRENPWPALALAVGAGVLLSGTSADVKAASAAALATRGATGKVSSLLDDIVAQVVGGFHGAVEQRIDALAGEVKRVIASPGQSRESRLDPASITRAD